MVQWQCTTGRCHGVAGSVVLRQNNRNSKALRADCQGNSTPGPRNSHGSVEFGGDVEFHGGRGMRSAGVEWERNAWNAAFVLEDSAVASFIPCARARRGVMRSTWKTKSFRPPAPQASCTRGRSESSRGRNGSGASLGEELMLRKIHTLRKANLLTAGRFI